MEGVKKKKRVKNKKKLEKLLEVQYNIYVIV